VKKVLANSEPSYKRTLKKLIGVLEYLLICELLLVKLFHDSQTGHAEFTFPKSFRNSKHRNERNETACARWRLEENPKATIALGRAFFANEHGTGRKVFYIDDLTVYALDGTRTYDR
jgi:hypothetical protein